MRNLMREKLGDVPPAWRRWVARLGLAAAVAGAISAAGYWMLGGSNAGRAAALEVQLRELGDEGRRLAADNSRLAREIDALKSDPRAIEDIARDELGLVYPGEVVFRVEGVQPASAAAVGQAAVGQAAAGQAAAGQAAAGQAAAGQAAAGQAAAGQAAAAPPPSALPDGPGAP